MEDPPRGIPKLRACVCVRRSASPLHPPPPRETLLQGTNYKEAVSERVEASRCIYFIFACVWMGQGNWEGEAWGKMAGGAGREERGEGEKSKGSGRTEAT